MEGRLTDSQIAEFLKLTRESDSVELKLTVPEAGQRKALAELGIDPLDAQIRQVYFFDTPDLDCNKAGVVVRTRRVQNKGDDSVVKLRPVIPTQLPDELRQSPMCKVEVDAVPGGFVCSASYKGVVRENGVKSVIAGEMPLRKAFSKEQRAFFAEHAPEGVALDELSTLGPIFVLKLKFAPKGFDRKIVAEMWLYPDDSRIVELSTKCMPNEAFQVANEARAFFVERGIDLGGAQEPKTGKALQFFAEQLKAKEPAVA